MKEGAALFPGRSWLLPGETKYIDRKKRSIYRECGSRLSKRQTVVEEREGEERAKRAMAVSLLRPGRKAKLVSAPPVGLVAKQGW